MFRFIREESTIAAQFEVCCLLYCDILITVLCGRIQWLSGLALNEREKSEPGEYCYYWNQSLSIW